MYMHVCVCAACVRAARVRAWPSAGEMGIRIRRTWISAPDAHPERKSKFSGCGFGRRNGNPHPKNLDFRSGCASGAEIQVLRMRIPIRACGLGLRAEMMVGMPTIISALDSNPERKSQRRDGGMQSFCA